MKSRRRNKTRGALAVMAVALVLLPQSFLSCDIETAGQAISFNTAVQGTTDQSGDATSFETAKGWSVTLTSARAAFGPIYFYSGAPMARTNPLTRLLGGVAMACPTHAQYDYGAVLGEVLEQYVVDLLASEPTSTGEVTGEAGTCHSAELHLHPPGYQQLPAGSPRSEIDELDGDSIVIAGAATKDSSTVPFRAALDIPDEGTQRIVQNIAGDVALEDASDKPGSIVLQILVDAWLDQVDFSTLTETDEGGDFVFGEGTQARTALIQAIRNRYSYRIDWRKP